MTDTERMGRGRADRDLLLGVVALENRLIDDAELVEAIHEWVADKSRPLAAVLRARSGTGSGRIDDLEVLVAALLERHGGDAGRALAAIDPLGPVRRRLAEIEDEDLQGSLAWVGKDAPTEPFEAADATAAFVPLPVETGEPGARFRVLEPHAHGGLGEVFVALDLEFNRKVALKRVRDRFADEPRSRAMLRLEAQVTGRLEHPGIVPVYGLGHDAAGRPFYAMRFIKGDSLREAIARFHRLDTADRDPGERALTLRRLLGRFIDVCNAVEYAHDRGVLHRDLKPGNIMLGRFGETLVVDWGLVKIVGRPDHPHDADATDATLRPAPDDSAEPTPPHSLHGTVRYMSPEQAAGRIDLLGPESDVYGLGATLYCLLTGVAPVTEPDTQRAREMVRKGEFPPPRRVKPAVPASLDAVCLKAMALRPGDRYPSARALADDVERWLADEPVSAVAETVPQRGSRWLRRHRPLAAAAAALLVTATLALACAAVLIDHERQAAVSARNQAVAAEGAARAEKEAADEERARALQARNDARAAEARALKSQRDAVEARKAAESSRDQALAAEGRARAEKEAADEERARALQAKADALAAEGRALKSHHDAEQERKAAESSRDQALAANGVARGTVLRFLSEVADERLASAPGLEPVRRRLIDEAVRFAHQLDGGANGDPRVRRFAALVDRQAANLYRLTGGFDQAFLRYRDAVALYDKLTIPAPGAAADRSARAHVLVDYAEALRMAGDRPEALKTYRGALAQAQALPDDDDSQFVLARSRYNLANALIDSGDYDEARALDAAAVPALLALIDRHDKALSLRLACAIPLRDSGTAARGQGRADDARRAFEAALGQLATLDDALPAGHGYKGDVEALRASVFIERARLLAADPKARREALETLDRAVAVRDRMASEFPLIPHRRSERAEARLVRAELAADDPDRRQQAAEDAAAAVTDLERLLTDRPQTPYVRGYLGRARGVLGRLALDRKDFAAARDHLTRAVADTTRALDEIPGSPDDAAALSRHRDALARAAAP